MAKKNKTFLILDGNALLHRAWHALPPLTTKDGTVVNAVYGFAMVVEKMLDGIKPEYMAVAWDLPGKTFRHEKFADYKAQREVKEQELYDQIPMIQEMLDAYGIPSLDAEGYEADDIIGTLAEKTKSKDGVESLIVTGDLDSLQLVNDSTKVLFFQKGISETKRYDEKAVIDRYGLTPEQLIDYKALRGDPSDNIPGVAGIGEKTAVALIKEYGSIEGIFDALKKGRVEAKFAKKLEGQEQHAFDSRELVKIVCDVPLSFDMSSAKIGEPDKKALVALFREWQFKKLLKKYGIEAEDETPVVKGGKSSAAVIRDPKTIEEQFAVFHEKQVGLLMTEQPADLFGSTLALIAVSDGNTTILIPNPEKQHLEELKALLQKADSVIVHGLKDILRILAKHDPAVQRPQDLAKWIDLEIGHYLLASGSRSHDLFTIVNETLSQKLPQIPDKFTSEKDQQVAGHYVALFPRIYSILEATLKKDGLLDLFRNVEMPLIPILFTLEKNGIKLDTDFLKDFSKELDKSVNKLTKQIHRQAGEEFNVNSPLQLAPILFEKLGIPTKGIKRTKSGFSTAAPELEKIFDLHPIVPLISEYRELAKLKSTYVDALPKLVKEDGRLHTSFNQTVTSTGRLSSSDPNLQNIPIKTEIGNKFRNAFICEKGTRLIAADYSQIELRLAAVITKDKAFIKAFKEGADIHQRTAAEVWGISEDKVTKEQRHAAKAINFGILYGMGSRSLARSTGFSMSEAADFIDKYFEIHTAIRDYIDETKALAHEQGYVETLFGRRRYLPEINSGVQMLVAAAERMAINMPIQGTAADIMKMAMIEVDSWIRTLETNPKKVGEIEMLLQVHDELVFEVDNKQVDTAAKSIKDIMETVVDLEVPLAVDVEVGTKWGEMKPWT